MKAGGPGEWLQLERSRYCLGWWEEAHSDDLSGTELGSRCAALSSHPHTIPMKEVLFILPSRKAWLIEVKE